MLLEPISEDIQNNDRAGFEIRKQLEKYGSEVENFSSIALVLIKMTKINVTLKLLIETKIGFTLNDVRKVATDEELRKTCKDVLRSWKKLLKEGGGVKLLKEEGGRRSEERGAPVGYWWRWKRSQLKMRKA